MLYIAAVSDLKILVPKYLFFNFRFIHYFNSVSEKPDSGPVIKVIEEFYLIHLD